MYDKKKMQKGDKISKGMTEDYTSMPKMNMKEVIDSANRTSKMEAEAGKKLMEVPSDKKKSLGKLPSKVRNKMGYKKKGGKIGRGCGAALRGGGKVMR